MEEEQITSRSMAKQRSEKRGTKKLEEEVNQAVLEHLRLVEETTKKNQLIADLSIAVGDLQLRSEGDELQKLKTINDKEYESKLADYLEDLRGENEGLEEQLSEQKRRIDALEWEKEEYTKKISLLEKKDSSSNCQQVISSCEKKPEEVQINPKQSVQQKKNCFWNEKDPRSLKVVELTDSIKKDSFLEGDPEIESMLPQSSK